MGYEAGKIYRIKCDDYFYYGSCITSLARRATTHRYKAKLLDRKLYNYIKDKEWTIELVCEYPCNTKTDLMIKEDEYVRPNLNNLLCLNERSATWDKEKDSNRKKEWYKANKERICTKRKQQYQVISAHEANMLHQ